MRLFGAALQLALGAALICAPAPLLRATCLPPDTLARALRTTPDAAHNADLGRWYAAHQQFGCATEVLRKAVALDPASADDAYLLGLSLSSSQHSSEAIPPLEAAVRLAPRRLDVHLVLGTALDATGDPRAAEVQWRLALALDPQSALALRHLSHDLLIAGRYSAVISLLLPLKGSPLCTDDLAVDLSVAQTRSGLLQDASNLLAARLKINPGSIVIAEALSGVLLLQSRFADATGVLVPFATSSSATLHTRLLYLQTLVLGHDATAAAVGHELLAQAPRDPELLFFLGLLRQQEDDDAGAADFYRRSLAVRPGSAETHLRLGTVLLAQKQNAAAQQQLLKARDLGLDTPDLHANLARTYQGDGNSQAAQAELGLYSQRLQAQAQRAQAASQAQRGDQAAAAGDLQTTVEAYRQALALDPAEPVLAYKLAMALDKTGDRAGEQSALQQALALDPHMAVAYNQLGYLQAAASDDQDAIHSFQQATNADPGFARAWLNLAASLYLLSRLSEARDALAHVLQLEPGNPRAQALLASLDRAPLPR